MLVKEKTMCFAIDPPIGMFFKLLPQNKTLTKWLSNWVLAFAVANVGQHHSLKKIFLGFYKNSFRFATTIFPDTPKSFGQKDF